MSRIFFHTLFKPLNAKTCAQQIVQPLTSYRKVFYSNHVKNKLPPTDKQLPESSSKRQELKLKVKRRSWKILLLTMLTLIGSSWLVIYLFLILGAPETDMDGTIIRDDTFNEPILRQYIIRASRELKYYLQFLEKPKMEKLLPDPLDAPYNQPKYTLVIELTDVMVHLEWTYSVGWRFKKRPLLDHFLDILKDSYEIVLYTSESGRTVFSLMEMIDPKNVIAYKLVRGTTHLKGFHHVKDLNNLNRDLRKVICIDWNDKNVKLNPENLLKIKRWLGRDDDTSLLDLAAFLKTITDSNIEDVREVLKYYSKYSDPVEAFRKKQEMLIEKLDEAAAQKGDLPKSQSGFNLFS